LPDQWTKLLKGSAITAEDAAKNPQAVLDVLEFYTEQTKREQDEYGSSHLRGAVENSGEDRWLGLMPDTQSPSSVPSPLRSDSFTAHRPAPKPGKQNGYDGRGPEKDINEMMDDLAVKSVCVSEFCILCEKYVLPLILLPFLIGSYSSTTTTSVKITRSP
jgi:protein-serine/threonine kinase